MANMFKKIFTKFPTGMSPFETDCERSPLPDNVVQAMTNIDKYAEAILPINQSILLIMVRSTTLCPPVDSPQWVEDPKGESAAERLIVAVTAMKPYWAADDPSGKLISTVEKSLQKYDKATRTFQRKGRETIHKIRTFVRVHYHNYCEWKEELVRVHKEMDQYKEDMKSEKAKPNKKDKFEATQKVFNSICEKIIQMDQTLPDTKHKHWVEMTTFYRLLLAHRRESRESFTDTSLYLQMKLKQQKTNDASQKLTVSIQ